MPSFMGSFRHVRQTLERPSIAQWRTLQEDKSGGGLNWCHGDTEEKTSVSFISRLSPICRKGLETRLDICVSIIEIQSSSDLDLYMTFVWE